LVKLISVSRRFSLNKVTATANITHSLADMLVAKTTVLFNDCISVCIESCR